MNFVLPSYLNSAFLCFASGCEIKALTWKTGTDISMQHLLQIAPRRIALNLPSRIHNRRLRGLLRPWSGQFCQQTVTFQKGACHLGTHGWKSSSGAISLWGQPTPKVKGHRAATGCTGVVLWTQGLQLKVQPLPNTVQATLMLAGSPTMFSSCLTYSTHLCQLSTTRTRPRKPSIWSQNSHNVNCQVFPPLNGNL